jgi:hypothetical protein
MIRAPKRSGSCFPRETGHFGHQPAAWQRVRDSNPVQRPEGALIYICRYLITSKFRLVSFCVAAFVAHIAPAYSPFPNYSKDMLFALWIHSPGPWIAVLYCIY